MAPLILPFVLGSLLVGQSVASAPKVIALPIRHSRTNHSAAAHDKRDDPFAVSLENLLAGHQYFATAGIGTPPQNIELVIDTGSSDTWMFATGTCKPSASGPCIGGEFDSSDSSSYKALPALGQYKNRYGDGSRVKGPYFSDNCAIGGETVKSLTMGLVNHARGIIRSGIMGVGLSLNEGRTAFGKRPYPNLPDLLLSQGLINAKAFSLYLDNLGDATGSILFGGYDSDKYEGDIVMLPLQTDPLSGREDAYYVSLVAFGLSSDRGKTYVLGSPRDPYPIPVLLDSGTENINIPLELFEPFIDLFNLQPLATGSQAVYSPYQVDCDAAQKFGKDSIVFAFGSNNGPIIAVPIEEMIVPFYNPENGKQVRFRGKPLCRFGIAASVPGNPVILGQTFLRSAYALYDLENKAVGLAQAKFDATSSNVVEYSATGSNKGVKIDSQEPEAYDPNYRASSYVYDLPKTADVKVVPTFVPAPADTEIPPARVAPTPAAETGKTSDNGASGSLSDGSGSNSGAGTVLPFAPSVSLTVAASLLFSLVSAVYIL